MSVYPDARGEKRVSSITISLLADATTGSTSSEVA
jgi:hypothetical protein